MKQTTLDLNGPILSFLQQPVSSFACHGQSATFVAIATAFFPDQIPTNFASNTGIVSYRWYADGYGALSDGNFLGATISGTASTTLTLNNVSTYTINGVKFYAGADYIPSAYSQPVGSAVTIGTGRSTGNAINEILKSNFATLSVYPTLSVTQNPTDAITFQGGLATFSAEGSSSNGSSVSYQWQLNGSDISESATAVGVGSTVLSLSLSTVGLYSVRSKITHPTSCDSPIYTNSAALTIVPPRQVINFEIFNENATGPASVLRSIDLANGSYEVSNTTQGITGLICFYAAEKDFDILMDIYAGRGAFASALYNPGEGGVSTIRLTLKKNEEYVITSLLQVTGGNAVFLYRKGRLIAVCGAGGSGGADGPGGDGGGVDVAGGNGFGIGGGAGGAVYAPGTLPSNGIFGSVNTGIIAVMPGDGQASVPYGGRVLPCPKGFWYTRGYAACADVGTIQFYRANAYPVTDSAYISRGFKAGYGIRNTAGRGYNGGGNGGGGATGGNGGSFGGGGGGSGYSDGSIQVISTKQGGNFGDAKVVFRTIF